MNESDPTSPTTGRARPIPIALLPWECAALSKQNCLSRKPCTCATSQMVSSRVFESCCSTSYTVYPPVCHGVGITVRAA